MGMIKLQARNDWQNAKWYFYTMNACELFMNTLRDHGANIDWMDPVKMPSGTLIGSTLRSDMDKDPRERAVNALGWAFNSYIPDNPKCDISKQMAENIMKMNNI